MFPATFLSVDPEVEVLLFLCVAVVELLVNLVETFEVVCLEVFLLIYIPRLTSISFLFGLTKGLFIIIDYIFSI